MLSLWLTGNECQAVSAMCGNFVHDWSDVEDNGAMRLRFPGSIAVVEGTWTTPAAIAPGPEIFCRGSVYVRVGNGTNYRVITTVKGGMTFDHIVTARNGWNAIVINGRVGWVSGKYSMVV